MRVTLALDSDPAGTDATERAIKSLSDWLTGWGIPRSTGPVALALATAQREYDAAARHWATLATICDHDMSPDLHELLDTAHAELQNVAEYVVHLVDRLDDDKPYIQAETADELIEATKVHRAVEDIRHLDWRALRQRVSLEDLASHYTTLRPRGRSLAGKCPLPDHEDSTPSFHVYPDKRNWYCFGCHRWGDVFDLAKALDIDIRELRAP